MPVGLGVVLLRIQHRARDVLGDVIGYVIAENKGDGLALLDDNAGHDTLTHHARPLYLFEPDDRTAVGILIFILSVVDDDV